MTEAAEPYNWETQHTFDGTQFEPPFEWQARQVTEVDSAAKKPRLSKMLRYGGAIVMLTGAFALTLQGTDANDENAYKLSDGELPELCAPPRPHDLEVVTALFERPSSYSQGGNPTAPKEVTFHAYPQALRQFEYGDSIKNMRVTDLIHQGDVMAKKYGVRLRFVEPNDNPDQGFTDFKTGIPSLKTKLTVLQIMKSLSTLPEEYVRYSRVKEFILARGQHSDYDAYASRGTKNLPSQILFNVDARPGEETLAHEVEHLVDENECGGLEAAENDQAYEALNNDNIYGKQPRSSNKAVISLEKRAQGSQVLIQNTLNNQWIAYKKGDKQEYCRLQRRLEQADRSTIVRTEYSFTNAMEDKAEMAAVLGYKSEIVQVIDPNYPILKAKFLTLMARLYAKLPNVVRYYADNTDRPYTQKPLVPCD